MTQIAEMDRTLDCFANMTYEVPEELQILRDGEAEAEFSEFGCFRILSQVDGDRRVVWCRRKLAQIAAAKQMFMDLIEKGMMPYRVGVDGAATSKVMDEFDPTAEEVIFMPLKAISGG